MQFQLTGWGVDNKGRCRPKEQRDCIKKKGKWSHLGDCIVPSAANTTSSSASVTAESTEQKRDLNQATYLHELSAKIALSTTIRNTNTSLTETTHQCVTHPDRKCAYVYKNTAQENSYFLTCCDILEDKDVSCIHSRLGSSTDGNPANPVKLCK